MSRRRFRTGKFIPRNPEKYRGNVDRITYRSSWELKCFEFLDNNRNILEWGSEILVIPYVKPDNIRAGRPIVSRYFPDLWVKTRKEDGSIIEEVIEIKPMRQATPSQRKTEKARLRENQTYELNVAKWRAAKKWCEERGMIFRILTEQTLF